MIDVKENTDGTFTISWDEEGPEDEIYRNYTAEDFIKIIKQHAEESKHQSQQPDLYEEYVKDQNYWKGDITFS